jgi:hypothetical protein
MEDRRQHWFIVFSLEAREQMGVSVWRELQK